MNEEIVENDYYASASYVPMHSNVMNEETAEDLYEEMGMIESPEESSNAAEIPGTSKFPLMRYYIMAAALTTFLLTAVTLSLLLIPLIKTLQSNTEIQGDGTENATKCVIAQVEKCNTSFSNVTDTINTSFSNVTDTINTSFSNVTDTINTSFSNVTDTIEGNTTSVVPTVYANSCSDLPNSSPSGYYRVLASNGSRIRVFCDMNMTCGNIAGGWMRVTSLDMTQPYSECPSNLCLNTTVPRTCRRCYGSGKMTPPVEKYHVGISYSNVCGRVIAYQVGKPNAYSSRRSNGVDGITLTYGARELHIWTFVAASQGNYRNVHYACPCLNLSDHNIPEPPKFISNRYFCDTAASTTQQGVFYKNNPLWDGMGCENNNQCCSFNHPPWFYHRLPQSTSKPIKIKINLNDEPAREDLAIVAVDIYVQ